MIFLGIVQPSLGPLTMVKHLDSIVNHGWSYGWTWTMVQPL